MREHQISLLVSEGLTNKEIADKLGISYFTVKSHVHLAFEKLRVKNRIGLAREVYKAQGLLVK